MEKKVVQRLLNALQIRYFPVVLLWKLKEYDGGYERYIQGRVEHFEASEQQSTFDEFIFILRSIETKIEDSIGDDYLLFVQGIMMLFATCHATSGFSLKRRILYSYHILP